MYFSLIRQNLPRLLAISVAGAWHSDTVSKLKRRLSKPKEKRRVITWVMPGCRRLDSFCIAAHYPGRIQTVPISTVGSISELPLLYPELA